MERLKPRNIRIGLSLLVVIVAVFSVWKPNGIDSGDIAALLACIVLLVVFWAIDAADLKDILRRASELSLGPLKLVLQSAADAARSAPAEALSEEGTVDTMFELRMRLEQKLAYVARHLFVDARPTRENMGFATIGDLRGRNLLTPDQARTADAVMTLRDEQFLRLPDLEREQLRRDANVVVTNFRLFVFRQLVRRRLEDGGWHVEDDGTSFFGSRPGGFVTVRPTLQLASQTRTNDATRVVVVPTEMEARAAALGRGDVATYRDLLELAAERAMTSERQGGDERIAPAT